MSDSESKQDAKAERRWRSDEAFHSEIIRMARENRSLTFMAALLFLPLLAAALYYTTIMLFAPKHVSVGIMDGTPDTEVMNALKTVLPKTKARVRLDIKTYDSPQSITAAMEKRQLDMGILRSDLPLPSNSRSVVNLREVSVAFVALASAETKDIRGLAGKPVSVLSPYADATEFAASLMRNAGVKEPSLTATTSSEDAGRMLKSGKAAAIAIVDAPERGYTRRNWRSIASGPGNKVELLPLVESNEVAVRNPGFTEDKIAAKSISVKPAFPDEEVTILKTGYLLLARNDLDRSYVAAVAETLYSRRIEIARTAPSINSIKTIDNEYVTSSLIPVHDGALDYFRREQMSFYERYNDIIWLFIFYGGSLFSGVAWLGQSMFRTQRERERNLLREFSEVLEKVEEAKGEPEIVELSREVEALVGQCMTMAHHGQLSQKRLTAISLGYSAIQSALQRKRNEMGVSRASPGHEPQLTLEKIQPPRLAAGA